MNISAYSQCGMVRRKEADGRVAFVKKRECQDKILVGDTILSEGFYTTETQKMPITIAVADGVGGANAAEVAAFMAVDGVRNFNGFSDLNVDEVRGMLQAINEQIVVHGKQNLQCSNMATTLTGIYFEKEESIIFHVGNTRAYLVVGGQLSHLTKDHTVVQEYQDLGKEDIPENKMHMVNSCMGAGDVLRMEKQLRVSLETDMHLEQGNMLLLTSDGIHDFVSDERMEELFGKYMEKMSQRESRLNEVVEYIKSGGFLGNVKEKVWQMCGSEDWEKGFCMELAQMARDSGSMDDISIVLIHADN